jgi:hypothetical protein
MKEIIVRNQKEFNKIKLDFSGKIIIRDTTEWLYINKSFIDADIIVSDNTTIESVYGNATIESVYGNATIKYVSDNATIEYVSGNAIIKYVSDNTTIESVYGNATIESVSDNTTIESVYGNATIESVYGNATIKYVSDNATIEYVSDNAIIKYVSDNATIEYVYGNATIEYVSGNATIKYVSDNAIILMMTSFASAILIYSAKKIVAQGFNVIRQIGDNKINFILGSNVTFIQQKETFNTNTDFDFYKKMYPVKYSKTKTILYKAVHKKNNEYISEYNPDFKYKIGNMVKETCDKNINDSCSMGIHLSHKLWAMQFGRNWKDLAILECESAIKDIVVSKDCDGKVRTSKCKVLRELPKEEYFI